MIHATAGERLTARSVVVATGHDHTPSVPNWPGRQAYTGRVRRARDYRNPARSPGSMCSSAGVGNSGSEIAADLAEGGARRVWIAVRTPSMVDRYGADMADQRAQDAKRRVGDMY